MWDSSKISKWDLPLKKKNITDLNKSSILCDIMRSIKKWSKISIWDLPLKLFLSFLLALSLCALWLGKPSLSSSWRTSNLNPKPPFYPFNFPSTPINGIFPFLNLCSHWTTIQGPKSSLGAFFTHLGPFWNDIIELPTPTPLISWPSKRHTSFCAYISHKQNKPIKVPHTLHYKLYYSTQIVKETPCSNQPQYKS